jgi:N-acetylneuraminic acid mutarotase
MYDPVTDTWDMTKTAPLTPRGIDGAGVIDGKLYVVGGCRGFPPTGPDCSAGITNVLEVYNPGTDTWTTLTPMPTPRGGLTAAVIDGKLYVVGGFPQCPPCTPQFGVLEVYDPTNDTWETRAPMPTPREGAGVAVRDGKLYVVGGFVRPDFVTIGTLEVYDPETDTWVTKAPMPTDRYYLAVGVMNGRLYAAGGYSWTLSENVSTMEEYDPSTDSWETRAPMPTACWDLDAGVIDNQLYVVGGANEKMLEVYTPPVLEIPVGIDINLMLNRLTPAHYSLQDWMSGLKEMVIRSTPGRM